jgi:hypothetical protein
MACEIENGGQLADRDPFRDEPTVVAWAQNVLDNMVPALENSGFVVSLLPTRGIGDVKYWVELGAGIMMDKPLIVVAVAGAKLSQKLIAVADEVVYLPQGVNPAGSADLMAAITRMSERLGGEEEDNAEDRNT